jgi:hypothetical protein
MLYPRHVKMQHVEVVWVYNDGEGYMLYTQSKVNDILSYTWIA